MRAGESEAGEASSADPGERSGGGKDPLSVVADGVHSPFRLSLVWVFVRSI